MFSVRYFKKACYHRMEMYFSYQSVDYHIDYDYENGSIIVINSMTGEQKGPFASPRDAFRHCLINGKPLIKVLRRADTFDIA